MEILTLALIVSNILGTSGSIVGAIDVALRRAKNTTAVKLFESAFVDAVKEHAPRLAHFTETRTPETVEVDKRMLDNEIASLKNGEIINLASIGENERLTRITSLFSKCIILRGHQLTATALEAAVRPVIGKAIANFLSRLPFNQETFNEFVLQSIILGIGKYCVFSWYKSGIIWKGGFCGFKRTFM